MTQVHSCDKQADCLDCWGKDDTFAGDQDFLDVGFDLQGAS